MQYKPAFTDKNAQYSLKQLQAAVGCHSDFLIEMIGQFAKAETEPCFSFKDLMVLAILKFAKEANMARRLVVPLIELVEVIEEQSEPFENPFRTDFLSHLNHKDLNAEVLGQTESNLFLHPKSPKVIMTIAGGEKLVFTRFFTQFNEKPLTSRIANNLQIIYPADESDETKKIFVKVTKDHQFTNEYEAECPVSMSIDLNKIHYLINKRLNEFA